MESNNNFKPSTPWMKEYMKLMGEGGSKFNFDGIENDGSVSDEEFEKVKSEIKDSYDKYDMSNASKSEQNAEKDEDSDENVAEYKDEPLRVVLRKAYCPICGTELNDEYATRKYNMYTLRYDTYMTCSDCKATIKCDNRYPRAIIIDKDGKEVSF